MVAPSNPLEGAPGARTVLVRPSADRGINSARCSKRQPRMHRRTECGKVVRRPHGETSAATGICAGDSTVLLHCGWPGQRLTRTRSHWLAWQTWQGQGPGARGWGLGRGAQSGTSCQPTSYSAHRKLVAVPGGLITHGWSGQLPGQLTCRRLQWVCARAVELRSLWSAAVRNPLRPRPQRECCTHHLPAHPPFSTTVVGGASAFSFRVQPPSPCPPP